jgi:beta-barrel assembly-enhancing protease
MRQFRSIPCFSAVLALVLASPAFSQRTQLKPGFNLFSPQQDVELGRQVAQDAEQKLPMLNNSRVDDYLNRLGQRLAETAPGEKYPYQFKCVNDSSINAFALPGGFLFVNRGTIEAADNEAELAGVIGHEIGHVALRHGTKQATKQAPFAILGGFLGGNGVAAIIAKIGTGFAANSILLKYSRDDERQADLLGAQILYDSNYDPQYLVTFFEKLDTKQRGSDFFSSHPGPEDRIRTINAEIGRLGAFPANPLSDSSEFRTIQRYVKSLPPAPKTGSEQSQSKSSTVRQQGRVERPSSRYQSYSAGNLSVRHPDNWIAHGGDQAFTLAPQGGIVRNGSAETLAYGAIMAVFTPNASGRSSVGLKDATDQLIRDLQVSNSGMRVSREQGQIRVGGQTALSRVLTNDSPLGGRETNWLVTVLRPEGLVYFIFVVPEQDFADYQSTFQQILNSTRFN